MKALHVLKKPVVTEKALKMGDKLAYTFYVNNKATKIEVKQAVKELYGEDVANVRITRLPSKTKGSRAGTREKRSELKKAIVVLKGNKKLDITKIAKPAKK